MIDGGNSRYTEDGPHAKLLDDKGIAFIDAGVSGGIWGLTEGYGLMVGGSDADVERAHADLRHAAAARDRGRTGSSTPGRSVPATSRRWCTTASSTR